MIRLLTSRPLILLLLVFVLLGSGTAVFAQTIVDPLPDGNLIENPWFREGNKPSLAGWTDAAGNNVIWSLSQKQSNPSADQVQGTSARLAFGSGQGGGTGQGGVDAYLYQVVAADASLTHLQFKIHWVTQWIDRAAVTIYGGNSTNGPWTAVWTPLEVDQTSSSGGAWTQTELLDTTIAEGFPFYKIELYGRYPDGRQQGAKYTGVYFSVDGNVGSVVAPAPTEPVPTAPPPAAPVNEVEPTVRTRETAVPTASQNEPETTAEETATPEQLSAANTPAPQPTDPPARPTRPQLQPNEDLSVSNPASNDSMSPTSLIIIGILLLLVIVLGIGWTRAARR